MYSGYLWILISALFDVAANIFMKMSNGFKKKTKGIIGLICIAFAYLALSEAIKTIDLSVGYSLWGGVGTILTLTYSYFKFGDRVNKIGALGILLVVIGMILIKIS